MTEIDAARYFPEPDEQCPTFDGDSEWHPLVDGAAYLPELSRVLDAAGPGDAVLVAGLELDPALDLHGRCPGEAGYRPLGRRLAELAAAGVDVRVLLACRALAASLPGTLLGGFRATTQHAHALRALEVDGSAPLARRVLLDFSGAFLGSNHQKAVVAHVGGDLVAFVGGIDLVTERFDAQPHDRLRLRGRRWGWHDAAVRLRGRAVTQVWEALRVRWAEAATLPRRRYLETGLRAVPLNVAHPVPAPGPAPAPALLDRPGVQVRVLRSTHRRKIEPVLPWHAQPWDQQPATGLHEVWETLRHAIGAAQRYVYIEDQYLSESVGGVAEYELYPQLRDAAERGVRIVLVGSGVRDPEDTGVHVRPINRTVNRDLRRKLVGALAVAARGNVAQVRVERLTVHAKLVLIDDVFACIGSANLFSRSMTGVDCELSAAVATSTSLVRDLRVALWAEHLRAPLSAELRVALEDLDLALGIWRPEWAADGDRLRWRLSGNPVGFEPAERALRLVGP